MGRSARWGRSARGRSSRWGGGLLGGGLLGGGGGGSARSQSCLLSACTHYVQPIHWFPLPFKGVGLSSSGHSRG